MQEMKVIFNRKYLIKLVLLVLKGDKINIVADDDLPKTALFNIIMGIDREYKGSYEWGKTIVLVIYLKIIVLILKIIIKI